MLHACYLLFIMCLCMSVKSSTELMLYVVLTMPTLNKAYLLFIYLFIRLVSGDNFSPRVLIYPNTFIQGQYVYNMITLQAFIGKQTSS